MARKRIFGKKKKTREEIIKATEFERYRDSITGKEPKRSLAADAEIARGGLGIDYYGKINAEKLKDVLGDVYKDLYKKEKGVKVERLKYEVLEEKIAKRVAVKVDPKKQKQVFDEIARRLREEIGPKMMTPTEARKFDTANRVYTSWKTNVKKINKDAMLNVMKQTEKEMKKTIKKEKGIVPKFGEKVTQEARISKLITRLSPKAKVNALNNMSSRFKAEVEESVSLTKGELTERLVNRGFTRSGISPDKPKTLRSLMVADWQWRKGIFPKSILFHYKRGALGRPVTAEKVRKDIETAQKAFQNGSVWDKNRKKYVALKARPGESKASVMNRVVYYNLTGKHTNLKGAQLEKKISDYFSRTGMERVTVPEGAVRMAPITQAMAEEWNKWEKELDRRLARRAERVPGGLDKAYVNELYKDFKKKAEQEFERPLRTAELTELKEEIYDRLLNAGVPEMTPYVVKPAAEGRIATSVEKIRVELESRGGEGLFKKLSPEFITDVQKEINKLIGKEKSA